MEATETCWATFTGTGNVTPVTFNGEGAVDFLWDGDQVPFALEPGCSISVSGVVLARFDNTAPFTAELTPNIRLVSLDRQWDTLGE